VGILYHISNRHTEQHEDVKVCNVDVEQKPYKVAIIGVAYAIIYPGAVMVHFQYASPTSAAMMGPRRFIIIASATKPRFVI
jgi:hypothetical protein